MQTLKFQESGEFYFSENSYRHEFMENNFNDLLTTENTQGESKDHLNQDSERVLDQYR